MALFPASKKGVYKLFAGYMATSVYVGPSVPSLLSISLNSLTSKLTGSTFSFLISSANVLSESFTLAMVMCGLKSFSFSPPIASSIFLCSSQITSAGSMPIHTTLM